MKSELTELTFVENYAWGTLGWLFCEIAFNLPDSNIVWWLFGWTYLLGNWFYNKVYTRSDAVRYGGGTGPL